MKKLSSILLLIIVVFNSLGFIVCFSIQQKQIKKEMKSIAKRSIDPAKLILIKSGPANISDAGFGLKFIDKDEFVYRGKMYDVVRKIKRGDTTLYYCLNDVKEDQLIAEFTGKLKENLDPNVIALKLKLSQSHFFAFAGLLLNSDKPSQQYSPITYFDIKSEPIMRYCDVDVPPPRSPLN